MVDDSCHPAFIAGSGLFKKYRMPQQVRHDNLPLINYQPPTINLLMKTITFSNKKQPLLKFEAEEMSYAQDGVNAASGAPEFIIQAHGRVMMQEAVAIEEMLFGNFPCTLTVTEEGEELMHQHFHLTLITLDAETLVARIS